MRNRQQTVRKAAILIASLDRQTADALLAQMPTEQADAVRAAIDGLDQVSAQEQQATIEEFFRIGPLVPEKSPPGIELDGEATDEWLPSVTVRELDQSLPSGPAPSRPGPRRLPKSDSPTALPSAFWARRRATPWRDTWSGNIRKPWRWSCRS